MHIGMPPHVKEVILVGAAHCYNEGKKFLKMSGFKNFLLFTCKFFRK